MRVVLDLIDMQIDLKKQTTGFSFQLLQALASHKEIELLVLLSDYYLETLKPTRLLLETMLPKENIVIWYAPAQAKKKRRTKPFLPLTLLREALIQDLKPDVVILPNFTQTMLYHAPVSGAHLAVNTQLMVCVGAGLHKISSKKIMASKILDRANVIYCFSKPSYELLKNKFGMSQKTVPLQEESNQIKRSKASANEWYFENNAVYIVRQLLEQCKDHCTTHFLQAKPGIELLDKHLGQGDYALPISSLKPYAQCIKLNHYSQRAKFLYVDISFLHLKDHKTGIQRVVRSLLNELLKSPPVDFCVEPVFSIPGKEGFYFARRFTAESMHRPTQNLLAEPIEPIWGDKFLGLDFTGDMLLEQFNYLKLLHQRGVTVEFVIYDILPLLRPKAFPPKMFPVFKKWLDVVQSFDGMICISKAVADELQTYLRNSRGWIRKFLHRSMPTPSYNIRWFHLGADIENSLPTFGIPEAGAELLEKLRETDTKSQARAQPCLSFLMVGTIEPRKGYALVLDAFEKLWEKGKNVLLIFVGKQGWKVEALIKKITSHPQLNKRLFWLNGISDEFLEQVYASVDCFLGMSEAEGFGLPLIEAARHHLPMILRDIPVFKEIANSHAFYFNGITAEALSLSILNWIDLYHLDQYPKSDTMPWLTWEKSARQLKEQLFI